MRNRSTANLNSSPASTAGSGCRPKWSWKLPPPSQVALICCTLLALQVLVLYLQGRPWWCKCGEASLWVGSAFSSHTSQHLFDPYSITHLLHGVLFFLILWLVLPSVTLAWRFVMAIGIEVVWEVVENTNFIIERYRSATISLDYMGDSIANSVADVGCCAIGFAIARWIGWQTSIVVFVLVELLMLFWIRDNIMLNVIMLLYPFEAIKDWQFAQ